MLTPVSPSTPHLSQGNAGMLKASPAAGAGHMVRPGSFPYNAYGFPKSSKQRRLVLASTTPAPATQRVLDSPEGTEIPALAVPLLRGQRLELTACNNCKISKARFLF